MMPQWLLELTTHILSASVGFVFGIFRSRHDSSLEAQSALREERKQKIEAWRLGVQKLMGRDATRGHSPYFEREVFAQTQAYLSLKRYLSDGLKRKVEAVHFRETAPDEIVVIDYDPPINDIEVRDELLARIDELEKQWKLV